MCSELESFETMGQVKVGKEIKNSVNSLLGVSRCYGLDVSCPTKAHV